MMQMGTSRYTGSVAREPFIVERRRTPRIQWPSWAKIRGANADGIFEVQTVIDNISAGGFYVRLLSEVEVGARVFCVFGFTSYPASIQAKEAPRLAVRGSVLRVEPLAGGVYGVAVRILNYRFL